jgi:hypothetical protein
MSNPKATMILQSKTDMPHEQIIIRQCEAEIWNIRTKICTILIIFTCLFQWSAYAHSEPIPVGVTIINESGGMVQKLVKVRLDRRMSLEKLKLLSYKLVIFYNAPQKAFIEYYLPGQKAGVGGWGPWATTKHVNGYEDKTTIEFSSLEDVAKLKKHSIATGWAAPIVKSDLLAALDEAPVKVNYGGKIIGEWIFDKKYTVFKKDGVFMLNQYNVDGTQSTLRLTSRTTKNGLRLDDSRVTPDDEFKLKSTKRSLPDVNTEDYYVINNRHELEFWNMGQRILTITSER